MKNYTRLLAHHYKALELLLFYISPWFVKVLRDFRSIGDISGNCCAHRPRQHRESISLQFLASNAVLESVLSRYREWKHRAYTSKRLLNPANPNTIR